MALGDLMNTGYAQSTVVVSNLLSEYSSPDYVDLYRNRDLNEMTSTSGASGSANGGVDGDNVYEKAIITTTMTSDGGGSTSITAVTSMDYFPKTVVFCELRHEAFEDSMPTGPAESGLVFKWRPRDQIKTGMAALVLCLNIGCDPPDVIKIDPCARMECWIDPSSMEPKKAVDAISKALTLQYEGLKSKTRYKYQGDPTVEDVQKLCYTCRKYAKTERVLFHYNGHGVPKPTVNGELWFFNKHYTQYIPVQITELDSWLKSPSIYVFDCSAAGNIFNAFIELIDASASSGATKDCILLAACEAHETLPQSADFPADVFTSCLTTPIQMALRWLCKRSLLRESFIHIVIEKIPGRLNDRKTLLGELNWIFTAVTDTIAWNVLPHDLFQRLFRRDILVASLFRNFLLAERIMRSANCSPITYPMLPPTRQHHMWNAWDMAAEICLSQLPSLTHDPTAKFQPSPFFTEQLKAFELWLDHASEHKKPPEQLPIVLQVLLSHSHRSCALGLLGRFLDMGPWAVDLALSAGLFPYVLKLLQTTTPDLLLVFIWTKILALDKSCQVDLVKDEGHKYFIRFLDSPDTCHEQRAMAVFVLAVIVDGHKRGQEACIKAGLVDVCLKHLQALTANDTQSKPLFLQWLCLCLAKIWEDFIEAQLVGLQAGAALILAPLLSESQPEVRASAVFALGILLGAGHDSLVDGGDEDCDDDEWVKADIGIIRNLLSVVPDGSPLVRAEVAVALDHFVLSHKKHLKAVAATYWRSQPGYGLHTPHVTSTGSGYSTSTHYIPSASIIAFQIGPPLRFSGDNNPVRDERVSACSPLASAGILHGSPLSDDSSQLSDSGASVDAAGNGIINHARPRPLDSSLYLECIFSMCTLAKDPSPRIASLGRRILSIIGIEQAVARSIRTSTSGAQPGEHTTSAGVKLSGLARSSSWFDLSSGHLPLTFRTPPVSPPRTSYLMGIRRVSSLDFRPHLLSSPDSGLADPLLGYSGSTGHTERSNLPQSTIYNWSCLYFSKPLLTVSDDSEELISNRETKENSASDLRVKCQHYSVRKLDNQIASWNTNFETGTTTTVLQPFTPVVIAADEKERIRVWNYEEPALLNSFDNHEFPDQRISKLCLLNELDDSLLLAASGDGNVRVWKDYMLRGKQKLITAFSSLPVHGPNVQNVNAVVDWQQQSGYLFVSGEVPSIKVWDLEKEQLVHSIPLSTDNSISALAASHVHEGQFAAGFVDGFVKLFDIRTPEMLVCSTRQHVQERVVGIGFQPGLDVAKIVSASQAGDIQFLDTRNHGNAYRTINSHRGSLTALAIHRHAPIIASGSAKQIIKVFNLDGEQLGFIRYHPTFMAHKIGPVSCLAFHPYHVLLAAGAVDPFVTLYADDNFGR